MGSFKETWYGGYSVVNHLRTFGFSGKIYPVNPSYDRVFDLPVYPSMKEVPEAVDLAVIITPRDAVPEVLEECAQNGVRAAIVTSDGFAERDEKGAELQGRIVSIAKRSSMRLLGPNTIGTANTATGLVTTHFATHYQRMKKGSIAFCAQSGIAGVQAFPLEDTQYPFGKVCDFGNKCDANEVDLLAYLGDDTDTSVIALHIEDVKDGQRFLSMARDVVQKKPVLVIKPGKTEEVKKALRAHTGALAGEDRVYDAAFKQTGMIRLENFEQLLDCSKAFAFQPLPKNNHVAIVTTSGGLGMFAIDAAIRNGMVLAKLSDDSLKSLGEMSPTLASNPIDILTTTLAFRDILNLYEKTIEIALCDDGVGSVAVIIFEAIFTTMGNQDEIVEVFCRLRRFGKPITIWIYGQSLSAIRDLSLRFEDEGFPVYSDFWTAIQALAVMSKYSAIRQNLA